MCSGPRQKPRPRASATATHEIPGRVDRCSPEQPSFLFASGSGSSFYDQARGQTVATTYTSQPWVGSTRYHYLTPRPRPPCYNNAALLRPAEALSLSPPVHRVERVGGVTEGERKDRRFTGCRCGTAGLGWAGLADARLLPCHLAG